MEKYLGDTDLIDASIDGPELVEKILEEKRHREIEHREEHCVVQQRVIDDWHVQHLHRRLFKMQDDPLKFKRDFAESAIYFRGGKVGPNILLQILEETRVLNQRPNKPARVKGEAPEFPSPAAFDFIDECIACIEQKKLLPHIPALFFSEELTPKELAGMENLKRIFQSAAYHQSTGVSVKNLTDSCVYWFGKFGNKSAVPQRQVHKFVDKAVKCGYLTTEEIRVGGSTRLSVRLSAREFRKTSGESR